jgi:hypothetical protein
MTTRAAVAGSCEYGCVILDPIKSGKFLEQLSNYQLLKNTSDPRSYLKESIGELF